PWVTVSWRNPLRSANSTAPTGAIPSHESSTPTSAVAVSSTLEPSSTAISCQGFYEITLTPSVRSCRYNPDRAGEPAGVSAAPPPDAGSPHRPRAGRGARGVGAHRVPRRRGPLFGRRAGVRGGRPRRRIPPRRGLPHPPDRAVGQGGRGAAPRWHARAGRRARAGHGVRGGPGQASGGHAQGGGRPGLRGATALPPRQCGLVQVLAGAGPPRPGRHRRVGGAPAGGRLPPLRLG